MKICLFGVNNIPIGKHNVKDSRLDEADRLVEADKKTYIQVDVAEQKEIASADSIVVTEESLFDLLLLDLEFIENRLNRNPAQDEAAALLKAREILESGKPIRSNGLNDEQLNTLSIHSLYTLKPVIVGTKSDFDNFDQFLVRVLKESGYSCFLTVGGKENRAWLIRQGMTAWEAAGVIHSDIQRGFIRAEIISYEDFIQHGGETGAKRAGKLRLEPKTYIMQECDIVNFRFNK
ncbi:MAG: DUF933 domain-containing protein [Verrucomicrobiia bacterium]|jgi:ribosome-binding ATPase YchF (GTP1/OBG family)